MKVFSTENVRNIALAGHSGEGKTSLAEAMLFVSKAIDRPGKIADGNTVLDFDPEEIKRRVSVSSSMAPVLWKDCKINLLDSPGLFDFASGVSEVFRAADLALIVLSAKSGVAVGAEKAYKAAAAKKIPAAFFVNKMDDENADFYKVLEQLKTVFGPSVCPVVVPFGDDPKSRIYINLIDMEAFRYSGGKAEKVPMPDTGHRLDGLITAMCESVAETDDELFEKYFSGEPFTHEELVRGIHQGLKGRGVSPVFCGSAFDLSALDMLLDDMVTMFPAPGEGAPEVGTDSKGDPVEIPVSSSGPLAAVVFKTVADPFVGKMSYFKVISGRIKADSVVRNTRADAEEKVAKLLVPKGKKQEEVAELQAGDIGAAAKMTNTKTGDTLTDLNGSLVLEGVDFPAPTLSMAVTPAAKGDEEKISQGLHRLMEEDPSISFVNNAETRQQLLSGLGEQHLDVIISKLKAKFGVTVTLAQPRVAYRETIRKKIKVQGKHKKQTGGHGQYGDVWIEFEPCHSEEMVFETNVFGGSVPKGFFPAVEKGLRECVVKGVLAGYPVVGLKATLVDGSYHPVDSSEMSFKMAAALAYRTGLAQASPYLLEPIGTLKAVAPEDTTGDIMGEINKRRGRVLGMNPSDQGGTEIVAEVPMAEMYDFTNVLRSMTQGRGNFSLTFERYEEAPAPVAQKVMEQAKAEQVQE